MNSDVKQIVRRELDRGERLIWAGSPKKGIVFRSTDVFMIPFSLMWGGFAIFWEFTALNSLPEDADPFAYIFPIFGLPFVAIGLYLIFGRFFHDSIRRGKTYYGLTDQRVIIVSGIFNKSVKSLNLESLADISLTEKSDLSGTITFGNETQMATLVIGTSRRGNGAVVAPKFEFIQNAKDVYKKIRAQQQRK